MTQPPHYPTQPPYNRQTPPATPGYPQPSGPTYPPNQAYYPSQPGPTYPQNQPSPQQPPSKSDTKTAIIFTTMGILLIALTVAVAYLIATRNNPTANPTPSATPTPTQTTPTQTPGRGWTLNGNQLTGPNMTAQLPPGWQLSPNNGANNDGEIIDHKSRIKYWFNVPRTAEESCKKMTGEYRRSPNDPVDQIQGQTWSGKPVLVHQLMIFTSRSETHTFYCLDTGNRLSVLLDTSAWTENKEEARSAAQILLTTWQWK